MKQPDLEHRNQNIVLGERFGRRSTYLEMDRLTANALDLWGRISETFIRGDSNDYCDMRMHAIFFLIPLGQREGNRIENRYLLLDA